jgi:hypothetical protein
MWTLLNHTPYAAGRIWGRGKNGVHEWIVGVKATFNIKLDGELVLAEEQLPPLLVPEYNGDGGTSSLRYDADLVGPKPATDVVLNGTAYAPRGRPAAEFLLSLRLGAIRKTIKVVGHRTWQQGAFGVRPSAPEPVTQVPVVYERAYGGFDQESPDPTAQRLDIRNPVGCGVVRKPDQALPNFEYPSGKLEKTGPAGFGALASFWSPRRELSGTYDEAWRKSRFPLLPEDWDPRSLLCSPADQRADSHLSGGEIVELENLTPDGRLRFTLPRVDLRFSTRIDNRTEEHRGQLATVIIEPDFPRVIMVWQSVLAVRNDGDYLEETVVTENEYFERLASNG